MSKDLQIIKELKNKFGSFHYKIHNNEVIELRLTHKDIINKDLELIGKLTSLQELNLYDNKITKIRGLNNLNKLDNLDLSGNEITEIKGVDKIVNLEKIDLCLNKLTTIQSLDNITKLKELYLSANKITKNTRFK